MAKGAYIGVKRLTLYSRGEEYTDITGGWGVYALVNNVASVKNDTNMYLYTTTNLDGNNRNRANTLEKVDITNYNKLCFELSNTGSTTTETNYWRSFGLVDELPVYGDRLEKYIGNYYSSTEFVDDGIKEIDISGVAGEHYICFFQGITRNTQIDRVWLESDSTSIRALPSGYTHAEYIQSSGTQYIDTLFVPNSNTRVVMDINSLEATNAGVFGVRAANAHYNYCLHRFTDRFRSDYYGTTVNEANIAVPSVIGRFQIDKNKNACTINGTTATNNPSTFSCTGNMLLFTYNAGGTIPSARAKMQLYSCQIYDNGVLVRDFVPCIDSSGTAGLYDMVNGVFYGNAGTGTFAVGPYAVARKVKNGYIGVDGKARLIKKAYIGIGGVARPFWGSGKPTAYGAITALSAAKYYPTGASVGDYALFAGGGVSSGYTTAVDAYNKSLTRTSATALTNARQQMFSGTIGGYALFAGGNDGHLY